MLDFRGNTFWVMTQKFLSVLTFVIRAKLLKFLKIKIQLRMLGQRIGSKGEKGEKI